MSKGIGELRNERVLWKLIYLMNSLEEIKNELDWAMHTVLIQKRISHSYRSKRHMCITYSCVNATVDFVLKP